MEVLRERDGKLTIDEVNRKPANSGFVAGSPENTNIGFSKSTWWVRFTLRSDADSPRLLYLRQDYPLIDSLELFEPVAGGGWRRHETGDRRPFDSRDLNHKDFLFPLTLPPHVAFDGDLWMSAQTVSYSSPDGLSWTEHQKTDWGERIYDAVVFFQGKLWMYGGLHGSYKRQPRYLLVP